MTAGEVDMANIDPALVAMSVPSNEERRRSIQSLASNGSQNPPSDDEVDVNAAPSFPVPKRLIGGVEVPMIVMNLDRAEKAFGHISTFKNVGFAFPFLQPGSR